MRNPLGLVASAWNALRARGTEYRSRFSWLGRNNAGVHITHDNALQVAAVWACIDVIASAVSSSDWNVFEGYRGADQKKAVRPDDTLQYVLNSRFNQEITAQSGKRALMIAAVGFGNGVAEIQRDNSGRIIGLWPLEACRVETRRYDESLELFYRIYNSRGGYVDLEPWEVFHVRGAGLTGFAGDDPIGRAIQSIAWSVALDQFGSAYFANNATLGLVIEHPGLAKMDQGERDRFREGFEGRHAGVDRETGLRKAFRVGLLQGGAKLHQLSVDAEKAQLVEAKHVSIEEICRWFRVPPHKIAHLLRATNNNIEHQGLEFSRDTIRPWKMEIEQECDWSLIPMRGARKFVELDVDWMEEGDYGTRATAYSTLRGCGVFTVNDVLRKLGENTCGPEGDVRTMNGATMPLKDVGKNMVPNQRKEAAPRRADDEQDDGVVAAWVLSVYQRIQRRIENRRADLERAGRTDAARAAQLDAMGYMDQALDEVLPALQDRWPDSKAALQFCALAVVRGAQPADAVNTLMNTLEKRTVT